MFKPLGFSSRITNFVILVLPCTLLTAGRAGAQGADANKNPHWISVAPGIQRTHRMPYCYALVERGHCLLIAAPHNIGPQTLPSGSGQCELVLLTHHHRDSSAGAAGFASAGVPVRSSQLSARWMLPEGVASYWNTSLPRVTPGRFPPLFVRYWGEWSYLVHPVGIDGVRCDVKDGETIRWRGWTIKAVATPGHSKDHTAYIASHDDTENQILCFCGDAISGPGKLWSPYTAEWHHQQDEGFAAASRSLRKLAAEKPTILLPEHGAPIKKDVQSVLRQTSDRLRPIVLLKNFDRYTKEYLGGAPEVRFLAKEQVGTANPQGNPKPWSQLSEHLFLTGNTYALASKDGPVLLMDPYSKNLVERVAELKKDHGFGPVEIAMISHAHNDHYTGIFALPDRKQFQVWTLNHVADVIENPLRWRAPYVDPRVPRIDRRLTNGQSARWREYTLKIHHLPGQTVFGLGVEVIVDGKKCFFTGDNFYHADQYTGSGGWSGRNRGLPRGYVSSAERILAARPDWILAEHGGAFEFNQEDFRRRRQWAVEAAQTADQLAPSGRHEFDWNPHRIRIEPLISRTKPGETLHCRVVVDNPTDQEHAYRMRLARPQIASATEVLLSVLAGKQSTQDLEVRVSDNVLPGRHVVPCIVTRGASNDPADVFMVIDVGSEPTPSREK